MIVHKFGGTLGNAQRFANVADIVIEQQNKARPSHPAMHPRPRQNGATLKGTVVVVSAMSGVTDQLIAGVRALQLLSEAGADVLLFSQSFSEHSLNLVVREQNQAHCLSVLRREFGDDLAPSNPSPTEENQVASRKKSHAYSLGMKQKSPQFPSWACPAGMRGASSLMSLPRWGSTARG